MGFRVGHGYDVHRLETGQRLILGGVEIPFGRGLVGHSDADVLTHAVIDAVLGAAGLGDIGEMFPSSDPTYRNASSIKLLWEAARFAGRYGWSVVNVDATVIAEAPQLGRYRKDIAGNIALSLGISESCVNIKATTEEGLGFTGAGEGIAAHAVCLISKGE